ncbi:hypothetical protein C4D60_Mb02t05030 [Musa balbisiana]|uniref:Uncharacterized protein n=1 Tax=Musa balbisiana TaxID=52838 RepID=A0A4S8IAP1_MUSBA|nr:hypothetical protein C4D60_Mb02t05030 [Musa balbisiana]
MPSSSSQTCFATLDGIDSVPPIALGLSSSHRYLHPINGCHHLYLRELSGSRRRGTSTPSLVHAGDEGTLGIGIDSDDGKMERTGVSAGVNATDAVGQRPSNAVGSALSPSSIAASTRLVMVVRSRSPRAGLTYVKCVGSPVSTEPPSTDDAGPTA